MSDRPVFGKVRTFEEAINRLPPSYDSRDDEMIMDLRGLRQTLSARFDVMPPIGIREFEERMVPLDQEAMVRMERESFKRDLSEPILLAYEHISPECPWWSLIFGTSDDDYKSWRITNIKPAEHDARGKLLCIETYPLPCDPLWEIPVYSEHSEYLVGWVKNEELYTLEDELRRNRRQSF